MLDAHVPAEDLEAEHLHRMHELLASADDPFSRCHFTPGHFTASAFVLDPGQEALLFIHHSKLHRWLQPGGHVDPGDPDVIAAARREVREETGVEELKQISDGLLDVDVHHIPLRAAREGRSAEPAHEHFDLRFLFVAASSRLAAASDALDARWVPFAKIAALASDESVRRAVRKLRARFGSL